ncbi:MAG: carbohydrate kinase family protein [bacterium]|nr:carbohydrate kinase family protein [bacterium]
MKYDIITIGAATRDVFLTSSDFKILPSKQFKTGYGECFSFGSKIELKDIFLDTGGGATNAAVTFANLGFKVACVTKVGDDADADVIIKDLKARGVATSHIVRAPKEKTAHSVIIVTPNGQRTVLVYRGASAHLAQKDLQLSKVSSRGIYVTSLGGNIPLYQGILTHAERIGALVAWNPGGAELDKGWKILKPLIARATVFNVNREEAAKLTGRTTLKEILGTLAEAGTRFIVVTDGDKGAYLGVKEGWFFVKTTGVKAVSATGAGDAFGSGFVAGLAMGKDAFTSIRIAMCNAEGVIQKVGAKNGLLERMPSQKMLQKVKITKL